MYKQITGNNLVLVCENNFNYFKWMRDLDEAERGRRKKRLEFQINRRGYFGSLANILEILRKGKDADWQLILEKIADDLKYLQDNYEIEKKEDL